MWNMNNGSVRVVHNGVEKIAPSAAQTIFPKLADPSTPGSNYMKAGLLSKAMARNGR
jgi:hypothetical protein